MTDVAAVLARGRHAAEKLMIDTCTISRIVGSAPDEDGAMVDQRADVYPDHRNDPRPGRCKVQARDPQESNPEAGGHTATIQRYRVDVPVATTVEDYKPMVGDLVTITEAIADPHLTGTQYRVVAIPNKSLSTAYRLDVTSEV